MTKLEALTKTTGIGTKTDYLVEQLRMDWDTDQSLLSQVTSWHNQRRIAADRIEALTAERDMALAEWDDCVERNRPRSAADTTAMTDLIAEIEFEAVNGEVDRHLAGRIITAMRALTAERDRAEDELYELQQTCITLRGGENHD